LQTGFLTTLIHARASGEPASNTRKRQLDLRSAIALAASIFAAVSLACSTSPGSARIQEYKDELGRTVRIGSTPRRIVSLAPSVTETLFALGLGSRVVGVTTFCDYPPEALAIEKIGDTMRPSVEKIVALKPDLVIASTASQLEEYVKRLDELGIPVYVSSPRDLDGVLDSILRVSEVAGVPARGRSLTDQLRGRIERVQSRVAGRRKPRVLILLGTSPLITAGGSSFINDLVARAGGESITAGQRAEYPQYSLEAAVAGQPEAILLQAAEADLPAPLLKTPAVRDGRVFRLDDALLLRPGPRIVDALEQLAAKLHPEAFAVQAGQP
jgi:cobalamin transport system substrate-binding protein